MKTSTSLIPDWRDVEAALDRNLAEHKVLCQQLRLSVRAAFAADRERKAANQPQDAGRVIVAQ